MDDELRALQRRAGQEAPDPFFEFNLVRGLKRYVDLRLVRQITTDYGNWTVWIDDKQFKFNSPDLAEEQGNKLIERWKAVRNHVC